MPTAAEARPLTATEQRTLDGLMKRAGLGHGSATEKVGEQYIALDNLSVPRINDPDHKTDLVLRGNPVTLTEEQAAPLLNRRIPVIRKASDGGPPSALILPRHLSGPVRQPPVPPRGSDLPRPDPEGSTEIIETRTAVPEATPPLVGDEEAAADPDAIDIPPRRRTGA